MTRPTLADLRAVLSADADDVSAAEDVLARAVSTRAAEARHPRWLAVAAAAVVTLVIGAVIASVRDASPARTRGPSSQRVDWRTFAPPQLRFTVRYPATWHAARFSEHSSFTDAIVFLSDQAMTTPCTTSSGHSETTISCRGLGIGELQPGRVVVNWYAVGRPPGDDLFSGAPGALTKVGGAPAKVAIGVPDAASDCDQIGGRTIVTATVQRPHLGNNAYVMQACINADQRSEQTRLVLASLRTMRQH